MRGQEGREGVRRTSSGSTGVRRRFKDNTPAGQWIEHIQVPSVHSTYRLIRAEIKLVSLKEIPVWLEKYICLYFIEVK